MATCRQCRTKAIAEPIVRAKSKRARHTQLPEAIGVCTHVLNSRVELEHFHQAAMPQLQVSVTLCPSQQPDWQSLLRRGSEPAGQANDSPQAKQQDIREQSPPAMQSVSLETCPLGPKQCCAQPGGSPRERCGAFHGSASSALSSAPVGLAVCVAGRACSPQPRTELKQLVSNFRLSVSNSLSTAYKRDQTLD